MNKSKYFKSTEPISQIIKTKPSLKKFYDIIYDKYKDCLKRCPAEGSIIEIGSGAGFGQEIIPELRTTDILPYCGLDLIMDSIYMPFCDESIRLICILDAFHHISNVKLFLKEAHRCLKPGGRIFMVEPYAGYIGYFVYKYLHQELYDPDTLEWNFNSSDPYYDANIALPWIVFKRDFHIFKKLFPGLALEICRPHTPLLYFISGGLKPWNLLPECAIPLFIEVEKILIKISSEFGSFVDIELVKLE